MSQHDLQKDANADWEFEQIRKVAAKFPDLEAEDLRAELAATIVEIKCKDRSGIRNWKAYLTKSLLNRASQLARKWRARLRWEISSEALPEPVGVSDKSEDQPARQDVQDKLAKIREFLGADSRSLL